MCITCGALNDTVTRPGSLRSRFQYSASLQHRPEECIAARRLTPAASASQFLVPTD
uniref:Uncharacterized protein n=1 Tax=Zea mays TaxID=4577 RepID=C0PB65_MAIZE|nr:unknown [Zea mays]